MPVWMLPNRRIRMFGQTAFREVAVTAIREVLRLWRAGAGLRKVAAQAWVDRRIACRCMASAVEAWQARDGGVPQLVGIIGAATDPVHQLDTTPTPTKAHEPIPALYLSKRPEGRV